MAWYENEKCIVCEQPIGKLRFWNARPRLVDATGEGVKTDKMGDAEAKRLLSDHRVVCDRCFLDHFDRLMEILASSGARASSGSSAPSASPAR